MQKRCVATLRQSEEAEMQENVIAETRINETNPVDLDELFGNIAMKDGDMVAEDLVQGGH